MDSLAIIQNKILDIRGQKVILDRDIAAMYGVETKVLKQAVRRNIERFPIDFMFELDAEEFENWRSQFVISNSDKMGLRHRPFAFTELGVAMLSSVLRTPTAIQVNMSIMRAFVAMRQMLTDAKANPIALLERKVEDLSKYVEDILTDVNEVNEDTRMQLDLINEAIAELQVKHRSCHDRKRIGFTAGD
ncbi:MAG: ORF6N domain-containing protein [Muribaculaceae bacterium]|nr:ORF6N domain-containing protein [Muribaculaceae bacterium]